MFVNVPDELNVCILYPPEVVSVPPEGKAVTVLVIAFEVVPLSKTVIEITSPADRLYTALGTATVNELLETL